MEDREDQKMARKPRMMGRLTLLLEREIDQAVDAVKEAARWLAGAETSDVAFEAPSERVGSPFKSFLELSDQVSKAAARYPHEAKRLRVMLKIIEGIGPELGEPRFHPAVQTFQAFCRSINALGTNGDALGGTIDHYSRRFEQVISGGVTQLLDEVEEGGKGTKDWHLSRSEADKIRNGQVKSRAQEIIGPEFIRHTVVPCVLGRPIDEGSTIWNASLVREIETGRATISYDIAGVPVAYGKLYSNESQARHSVRVQRELWNLGFDRSGPYQIPELLAYLPQYKLELIRAAEGRQLSTLFNEQDPAFATHARQAALWLVKLHRSTPRLGNDETLWQSMWLFKTLRRLAKASAVLPDRRSEMIQMVDRLCEIGERSFKKIPLVQTHGTFHYDHVFVNGATTSVIDFDRSYPSDPAKDLAEFLEVLRWKSLQLTGSVRLAEKPTKAFLEEYLHHLPGNSANLGLHWGADILRSLFRQIKHHVQDETYQDRIHFLRDEFESVLSGQLIPQ